MRRAAKGAGRGAVDVASDLDIVVGELAELAVIETHLLLLRADTQRQARDEVHEEQDHAGQDERVGEPGNAVGDLVAELDPVVVDPAAGNLGGAVEVGNVVPGDSN